MRYEGMLAETVSIQGHESMIEAYLARPLGPGPFPGVVLLHHAPGWDEWCKEATRKLAHHGYATINPNLYSRAPGQMPEDQAAVVRGAGGLSDDQVVGDIAGAMDVLRAQPISNGKVGIIGFCSGGRQAYLAGCRLSGIDAVVDCWGGNVVVDDPTLLNELRPVAPLDLTNGLRSPLLGLFGNDDTNPTPDQVDRTEEELKRLGKTYAFHRYDGAGHGFFAVERPGYRPEQAVDGWQRVFDFFRQHLG